MFSNNGQIHIPVSGGTPWKQVPEGSQYPSQERWTDGRLYAPLSEINRPRPSAPVISNNTYVSQAPTTYNPTSPYVDGLYNTTPESREIYYRNQQLQANEEARRQQEIAYANAVRASQSQSQYNLMPDIYATGGLEAVRNEYQRLYKAGGWNAYSEAAWNYLCAKDKQEIPIKEETTKSANNYYNEGGTEGLKHLINFYKSRSEFNHASVAQSVLTAKEKEEAESTPLITERANEYYETDGIESLRHLVKYYGENNYPVYANITKRILKQKEEKESEEEHNRRMQQDVEYSENYKIKETENEIRELERGIEEQKKINPFYGQPSSAAINERIKAFEYTKGLSYEAAKDYLDELKLPKNARFENSKIGADVALKYYFDKVIPLQNKIERAKAKIQEIENARAERMLKQKEKVAEIKNAKINKSRNVADMADDILYKRVSNDLDEDFDDKVSKTLKSTFGGVKEAFVETGEFIGEEVARLRLGEKTKTRQRLENINTFFEEEKERFDTGQTTKTGQALKDFGSYLKNESELIIANEKTRTEQFVRDTYRKIKDTPVEDIGHGIGKLGGEMLIGFGAFKAAKGALSGVEKIANKVKHAKRSASLAEVKLVKKSLEQSNQSMLRMWDSYKNNSLPTSAADSLRLKAELAFREAGFLGQSGKLTPKALEYTNDKRSRLIKGKKLGNPEVIQELTKNGQPLENWGKYTTREVQLHNGQNAEIHFYYNKVTGDVNYSIDYKVKELISPFDKNYIPEPKVPPYNPKPASWSQDNMTQPKP